VTILANYDYTGRIGSIVWYDAPKGVSLMLTPRPGEIVAEVEAHGIADKGRPSEEELRELAAGHRVETPLIQCKLVKTK